MGRRKKWEEKRGEELRKRRKEGKGLDLRGNGR